MRCLFVCADDFLWRLAADLTETRLAPLWLVEQSRLRARIQERGGEALSGRLDGEAIYRRAFRSGHEPVLVAVERARQARVVAAIRRVAPAAPLVVVAEQASASEPLVTLPPRALAGPVLEASVERATTRARVQRLREHFASAERVLIMMQDDPDPDAIASALGLKMLLGRTKPAATIATFGTITRPENRAMTRLLEIDVEQVKPRNLEEYDMLALVDTQPAFFEETLGVVDLVIDHHPDDTPVRATIRDVRPSYGATSTILTEYLRAADVRIRERLATALLYGIKTDTMHLERGATRADMEAFAYLHPLANRNLLRRIERPDLPDAALDVLARGLATRRLLDDVMFVHLGPVAYPELIAQFADFLLQVEGAEWSVVSGRVHGELHVSVRNVGWVRAAGDVVREAFGELGSAGGHRSMAKAVVKLRDWRAARLPVGEREIGETIIARFLAALPSSRE
ncbi:MAG TPA: bifunctional oligoribonuclease/PAP phosphatase NrnA [Methylomirabilota bacterium]|jgi:nanoRNase/pAp phosphatase (c-di-AMP/oligoRNAs hydrolase)|nr:bifunctional oligoribonuclease/PAP phosphatase NrnA [Methylomirabilota bacterium]